MESADDDRHAGRAELSGDIDARAEIDWIGRR